MDGLELKWIVLACAALASCPGAPITGGGGGSTGGTGDASSTGSATTMMPTTATTMEPTTTPGTTVEPDSDTGPDPDSTSSSTGPALDDTGSSGSGSTGDSGTTGTDSTGDTNDTNPGGLPDGSQCTMDSECFSDNCYVVGVLGGICGECNSDDDCDFGCSPPNPLESLPSECNAGELGGGCESSDACGGDLQCGTIINVPGITTTSTCGECLADGDCGVGETCQPNYDVANLAGHFACVDENSLPDGAGCDLANPDVACVNECAAADLMGLLTLGVCGECIDDGDCPAGQTCTPAEIDLDVGLVASVCM